MNTTNGSATGALTLCLRIALAALLTVGIARCSCATRPDWLYGATPPLETYRVLESVLTEIRDGRMEYTVFVGTREVREEYRKDEYIEGLNSLSKVNDLWVVTTGLRPLAEETRRVLEQDYRVKLFDSEDQVRDTLSSSGQKERDILFIHWEDDYQMLFIRRDIITIILDSSGSDSSDSGPPVRMSGLSGSFFVSRYREAPKYGLRLQGITIS